ncbi:Hypothetical predicted protein, partial [Pelobates cultripes]
MRMRERDVTTRTRGTHYSMTAHMGCCYAHARQFAVMRLRERDVTTRMHGTHSMPAQIGCCYAHAQQFAVMRMREQDVTMRCTHYRTHERTIVARSSGCDTCGAYLY